MDNLMKWWEYRLARGAGYSVWDSLASAFFNKKLDHDKREAQIAAERMAIITGMEKLDPALAHKMSVGYCGICGYPLRPNQVTPFCRECEKYKFE
jgi:hypothetical protein